MTSEKPAEQGKYAKLPDRVPLSETSPGRDLGQPDIDSGPTDRDIALHWPG